MQLGLVGLGKMGLNIARRLQRHDHDVVGFDRDAEATAAAVDAGLQIAASLDDLVGRLAPPRAIWVMVPAGGATQAVLDALAERLDPGDVVVDGGNSFYKDTLRRATMLHRRGLLFVDAGTSGGVWGLEQGFSLMIGGPDEAVQRLRPVFEALAPGPDRGWGHVGPNGAGHYVKMIHNGIEYGMMQALAEGFNVLHHKTDFGLDLHQVAEVWRYGSVIQSWLLDLTARTLDDNPALDDIAAYVPDSGEGRWTVKEALDLDVPTPVITLALVERLRSREDHSFADRLLAALRHQFGGHAIPDATD